MAKRMKPVEAWALVKGDAPIVFASRPAVYLEKMAAEVNRDPSERLARVRIVEIAPRKRKGMVG